MSSLKVSIVIISYRVRGLLTGCLQSVDENGFTGGWEVICVDNASGDGTVEALRPRFPGVRWIENKENLGFAPAVNQAVASASGDYLLLLAPDGVLIKGSLDRLVSFLDARPGTGIVGPRLLLPDGSPYMSATRFPTAVTILLYETRLNRLISRSRWLHPYRAGFEGGQPCAVDAVEGSCFLTRRAIWHQVGGFDARYFFGVEDLDYAWKVTRAGYGVWFHPEPVMIHHHSGSTGGKRRGTLILLSVSLGFLYFMEANRPTSLTLLRLPLLVIWSLKWALCLVLRKSEHRTIFREGIRALVGLRPAWITVEDRARWGA